MFDTKIKIDTILCAGDVHFFLSKRFEEHRHVVSNFLKILKHEKPDIVILTGDIIDSKGRLGAEQIQLVRNFLYDVASVAPIIMIPGNHDLNLSVKGRIDSLTPIVESLKNENINEIFYIKESGVNNLFGINFAVWSCIDDQKSPFDGYYGGVDNFFGLYHGVISGAKTEDGFTLSGGIDISEFDKCDIVVASDIHMQQNFRNGEVHYTGSLIQVSVNEAPNGSCLKLTLNDRKEYAVEVLSVPNDYSTINVRVGDAMNMDILPTQKFRLKYDTDDYTRSQAAEIAKQIRSDFSVKVDLVPIVKKKDKTVKALADEDEITAINVNDFFSEFVLKNRDKLSIVDFDSDLSSLKEYEKEFSKGEIKDFEQGDYDVYKIVVNNVLSYGPYDTTIDIDKEGIIGILGGNTVGKSSIIKILQFVSFYEVPNNASIAKMVNKHNKHLPAMASIFFRKSGKIYQILRVLSIGKKATETTLSFYELDEQENIIDNLTKESRQYTETEIRKHIGINETFEMLSVFSAQKKQTEFIDCKNAERLKLVNKFLGLQNFEMKEANVMQILKDKNVLLSNLQKQAENRQSISELINELQKAKVNLKLSSNEENELNEELRELDDFYIDIVTMYNSNLKQSQKKINDPGNIQSEIDMLVVEKENYQVLLDTRLEELKNTVIEIQVSNDMFAQINGCYVNEWKEDRKSINDNEKRIAVIDHEIIRNEKQLLVDTCNSCGKEFTSDEKKSVEDKLFQLRINKKDIMNSNLFLEDLIKEKKDIINKHKNIENIKGILDKKIQGLKSSIKDNTIEISELKQQISEYDSIQESKKIVELLKDKVEEYRNDKLTIDKKLSDLKYRIGNYDSSIKTTEKKIKEIKESINVLNDLENEVRLLKAYRKIVGKDGLPLYILNNKIYDINEKVNLIISQVFDFKLEFSIDEQKGELKIQFNYDGEDGNDIGLASGSETFVINLCIKVALSQISNLPKIDSFFIDEGYDSLDSNTIDKLPALFGMLVNYYKNVITISHMDMVKDICEHQILLHRPDKYTEIL